MIISEVSLKNFRCHEEYSLSCTDETTLILGQNGCGKTSVLEAIYIALVGRSFRVSDPTIMRRGAEFYRIEVGYSNKDKMVVVYSDGKKEFRWGEKRQKRIPVKAKYPVILFEPDDLHLLASTPTKRREHFDKILSQIDEQYARINSRYKKALTQRNSLLKREEVGGDGSEYYPWEEQLAKLGVALKRRRERIASLVNEKISAKYQQIAKNQDEVEVRYETEVSDEVEEYLGVLQKERQRDMIVGHTRYGAHKDDFIFCLNGEVADGSASRGEVRTIILALKFIEAEIMEATLHKKPLILLDDVFSELDEGRQEALKNNFKDNQIIITSVR